MPKDTLPSWSLTDLYSSVSDPQIARDVAFCRTEAQALATAYEGKIAQASAEALFDLISRYEALSDQIGKLLSHADLHFATDMTSAQAGQHSQTLREQLADVFSSLLFIELELAAMDEAAYQGVLQDPKVAHYQPWLRLVRAGAPYQLEQRLEQLLVERGPVGRGSWVRLFDETMAGLRFDFEGKEVSEAEILNMLSSPHAGQRREAAQSFTKVLKENEKLFTLILNVIAKDRDIDDKWRGFKTPVSSRNLANDVDDHVVDALAEAVTSRMKDISHRYYALKATWFGSDKLAWWDRNAPLLGDDDRHYSWDEATQIVIDSFAAFDPEMAEIAKGFFDKGWVDAGITDGKASGAFSHPTVPSAHPYILMNFAGKARDVMTLAHEMGHGIHQVLASRQGALMADTPLTLAETASVFAEMLTFHRLLDEAPDKATRRFMLAGKIEDMLNTVVRQIAFHNFEVAFHTARSNGELSTEEICDIWMTTQTEALGPHVMTDEAYRNLWSYIPHFIHSPFYVYAYAFGDCLVNALWQVYQDSDDKGAFVANYKTLLSAGGTKRYDAALAPLGLDAGDSQFWHKGLDMISAMIDELESVSA
ncbi:MAG: M3 family oligoendopeptidase [Candidatus Puniceispirillaceae bacterium]